MNGLILRTYEMCLQLVAFAVTEYGFIAVAKESALLARKSCFYVSAAIVLKLELLTEGLRPIALLLSLPTCYAHRLRPGYDFVREMGSIGGVHRPEIDIVQRCRVV
jgi:hypothetical protein